MTREEVRRELAEAIVFGDEDRLDAAVRASRGKGESPAVKRNPTEEAYEQLKKKGMRSRILNRRM